MSNSQHMTLTRVLHVATTRGLTTEITPDAGTLKLRFRHPDLRASATVGMDAGGKLYAWRTGQRPCMEDLKAALA